MKGSLKGWDGNILNGYKKVTFIAESKDDAWVLGAIAKLVFKDVIPITMEERNHIHNLLLLNEIRAVFKAVGIEPSDLSHLLRAAAPPKRKKPHGKAKKASNQGRQ